MTYFMTGPEGQKYAGYWTVTAVDEPRSWHRAVFTSIYESAEALQQVLDMGMIEGATSAMAQIDDLLAA